MTEFPKMGDGFPGSFMNMSRPSSNTTSVIRKNTQSGEIPGHGTYATRKRVSRDVNGPQGKPMTTLYAQNSPEASATCRNIISVQGGTGWGDFWRSRAQFGNMVNGV